VTDPRRYRPGTAAWLFMRLAAVHDAEQITDPDQRAAALAQVEQDYPMPTTNRRNPR
jgi:hypothetical protein